MNVTCDPRATVSVVGQTALLTMRNVRVSGSVEQVIEPAGPVRPELLPPHAAVVATATAAATAVSNRVRVTRTILPSAERLEELPRDVEAQIPVVLDRPAPGDLRHRRPERVREVQLEEMPAGALLDGEAGMGDRVLPRVRYRPLIAGSRHHFARDIDRRPDPDTRADADHERAVVVHQLLGLRVRVVHIDRLDVERRHVADRP